MNVTDPRQLVSIAYREAREAELKIFDLQRTKSWTTEAEIRGHLAQAIEALTEVRAQFGSDDT